MTRKPPHPATLAAQALGWTEASTGAVIMPVHTATTFLRDPDNQYRRGRSYGRADNPTYDQPQALLTALEGGAASLLFSSGMAAAAAVFQSLPRDAHVVAPRVLYWGLRHWLRNFATDWGIDVEFIDATSLDAMRQAAIPERTRLLWIETPANPLWSITDIAGAAEIAHAAGALLVVAADPVNLALLTPPGALGADIVVGEGQGLGVPMTFGGPNLGVFAVKQELVRRMPGRLVGATVDLDGQRGFVLTLQTREQHIRREKATSNICTNVALCALMATIHVAIMGKVGLRKVGELSTAKAHYAAEAFAKIPGVKLKFSAPFFKEFALALPKSPERVVKRLLKDRILAGVPLKAFDRAYKDCLLVAVTEKRTREEIDAYATALAAAVA